VLHPLGRSVSDLVERICGWAEANIKQVQAARAVYDRAGDETSLSA
jgi:DNA-binding HxlR family transcriptional regulator